MNIAYFISGHGFGHGIRSCAIINALQGRGHRVFIFSSLQRAFFQEEVKGKIRLFSCELDCGCIQHDALSVDVERTLARYCEINSRREALIEEFSRQLRDSSVELALADIPPLAFTVAREAGVPGYGISNFTWGDIYQPFLSGHPGFSTVFKDLLNDYARAEGYFSLYPDMPGKGFRRKFGVGTVARKGFPRRRQISKLVGLNPDKKWCIVYLGNLGLPGIDWPRLAAFTRWQFLGLYSLAGSPGNYFQIRCDEGWNYPDIMASCDLALGKLGYGLVGESLSFGLPIVFIERYDFAEFPVLKQALLSERLGFQITIDQLIRLDLTEALEVMSQRKAVPKKAHGIEEILQILKL